MGTLKLSNSSGNFVALEPPSSIASDVTLTLPNTDGDASQFLQTNGSGALTWATVAVPDQVLTSGTSVDSTSGTTIDFTSIPSDVKRITVSFYAVSSNGTSDIGIQLGTGSGPTFKTSGYLGSVANQGARDDPDNMASIYYVASASSTSSGVAVITHLGSNYWTIAGTTGTEASYTSMFGFGASLSGTLTAVRITTGNGTDTFDAGKINIMYEG